MVFTQVRNDFNVGNSVAVQSDGKIVVGGYSNLAGDPQPNNMFFVRYDSAGNLDSSFGVNGVAIPSVSAQQGVKDIAIDAAGTVYATGATSSQNFPVTSTAVQRSFRGYLSLPFVIEYNLGDAFITRLDAQGANLLYSTYFGGSQNDAGMAIAVDGSGLIYLSGMTDSTDFPVTKDAVQPAFGGDDTSVRANYFPLGDGFFAIVDPNSAMPLYSTYYGGQFNDALAGFALDAKGNAWMTG